MLYLIGMKEKIPDTAIAVNATSSSKTWSKELSPFYVGPIKMYDGYVSKNMENCWQFSKIYEKFVNDKLDPTEEYWSWAKNGWNDSWAHRYPMGKGAKPLYSLWNGQKLGYIEARKQIYLPLYAKAVQKTEAFLKLKELFQTESKDIYLQDWDAYNHKKIGWTYDHVLNCEIRKMGHAFILGMLLEKFINESN